MIQPNRRQLRKTRGQQMDEKHGIQYHAVRASYTVEEMKQILGIKSQEMKAIIKERQFFIDNYDLPLKEWWVMKFSRDAEHDFYRIKDIEVNREDKILSIHFVERKFKIKWKTPLYVRMHRYQDSYVQQMEKLVMNNITSVLPLSCIALMETDIGQLNAHDKVDEGINFISQAIKEFTTLKRIKKQNLSKRKWWEPMSKEMIGMTLKELAQDELTR